MILITNHFPFGLAESFLENEIDYLVRSFDKVIVLSRDVHSTGVRKEHSGFTTHRVNPRSNAVEKILSLLLFMRNPGKVIRFLIAERNHVRARFGGVPPGVLKVMLHDLAKAMITAYHVRKIIKKHQLRGRVILYSYWLTSSALATTFVAGKSIRVVRISRAHGGDVYQERNDLQYLSFRRVLVEVLDAIFAISDHGKRYLDNFAGGNNSRIRVARLGTRPAVLPSTSVANKNSFTVVSCSFLVPVKRIDRIIGALSCIDDLEISWVHVGDGPLLESLRGLAAEKLSVKKNIRYQFIGSMSNEALLTFYSQRRVDVFVNTSLSEGIPVTMMEAQSFGIPVVAPATGGIPEIVSPENGALFPPEASPSEIAGIIRRILTLPAASIEQMRSNAFRNWEMKYNAEKNFPTFVAEILGLRDEDVLHLKGRK